MEPTMGINQLPEDEQFQNADEALAQVYSRAIEEEDGAGVVTTALVHTITSRYDKAQRKREQHEQRWIEAYQNYRGIYGKTVRFREEEKSRVFVKVTKTKVLAAYGQIIDVLFGTEKFPLSIRETEVPEGAEDYIHFSADPSMETQEAVSSSTGPEPVSPFEKYNVGYKGDGTEVPPGAKLDSLSSILKGVKSLPKEAESVMKPGAAGKGEPEFRPAKEAAKRMEKLIHDQIEESAGARELRSSVFEACLLGTGLIKGPFTLEKTLHNWEYDPKTKTRTYKPSKVRVPRIEHCSVWDAFPDPEATNMEECEWFVQRHKMSRSQVRGLKNRSYFNKAAITEVLNTTPNYVKQDYETLIETETSGYTTDGERYEVLEYWGLISKDEIASYMPKEELKDIESWDEVQINAWICNGKVLRVVLNPFTPMRIPYLAFSYEVDPYSFFGVGVAENMSDNQQVMNGHARMAIDNLALAGNMVFDVDEGSLVPGQDMKIYPGKIFKRQAGQAGQAIYGIKFPSTANENLQMFDKFRQLADESTGIPSYTHGQTGITGTTRTAAGMSMLLGAASLNVKTVMKNLDDFLLQPLGEALFQWNMSFYDGDLDIVGDLEVRAGGTASLVRNEIRSQRLIAFGQLFSNPAIAPFIKVPAYVKAFVESLELDPTEFLNNVDEAKVYAAIMGQAGGAQGQQQVDPAAGGGQGELGAAPPPVTPDEQGFSGNDGTTQAA